MVNRGRFDKGRGRGCGSRGRGSFKRKQREFQKEDSTVNSRGDATLRSNPVDANGNPLRCYICDSTRHLADRCPHADEERYGQVHVAQFTTHSSATSCPHSGSGNEGDQIHLTLYNSNRDETLSSLVGEETLGMAVLDSACTKTVTGESWTNAYLDRLTYKQRQQVKVIPSNAHF